LLLFFLSITVVDSTLLEHLCHGENNARLAYCVQTRKRFGYGTTESPEASLRIVRNEEGNKIPHGNETEVEESIEDPSCGELRTEYTKLCFRKPPLLAFVETKAFCDAYVDSCKATLITNFYSNIKQVKVDFTSYCRRHKSRFEYVCPEPLRFPKYVKDTTSFCLRFHKRCPDVQLPSEPIPFKKAPKDYIYTRELEFYCERDRRFALAYCTNKHVLKLPRYAIRCAQYKQTCIDPLTTVIYG
ncbi:hypothetical protein PENTCL1PPCAC_22350, partial [Pristionchus entomophagus]